jgi:membrane protein DedA with SNARE-associated domain
MPVDLFSGKRQEGYYSMNAIDTFLIHYGLIAVFLIMLVKTIGVPIPIPGDVIIFTAAVRVAQGKLVGWQVFLAILVALLLGGLIQYMLARGPARAVLYRFGRYVGLTKPRIDAASEKIRKGGVPVVALAILVPGVRGAAVVAAGLVDLALTRFLIGLALGSLVFLSLHFFLGYLGGSALSALGRLLPLATAIPLVLVLLVVVYVLWVVAVRRQKAARAELKAAQREETNAAALEVWHEGICPVCLALYTANQLRSFTTDKAVL